MKKLCIYRYNSKIPLTEIHLPGRRGAFDPHIKLLPPPFNDNPVLDKPRTVKTHVT